MTHIPIVMPVQRSASWEENLEQKVLEYSSKEDIRAAFRDGAKWERKKSEPMTGSDILSIFFMIYLFIQICAAVIGFMEGASEPRGQLHMPGKTMYVFPGFAVGAKIGKWVVE